VNCSSEELLKIATVYLDEKAMDTFANALEEGYGRMPGET
jgi:hypothetical protein